MALREIPIGNTGAKFALDRENSYRKVILADGKEVNVTVNAESGTYSFKNEISYQKGTLADAQNLLEDYQDRIKVETEILSNPTSTEAAKKKAAQRLDWDTAGLQEYKKQVQEKTDFIATLQRIEAAGLDQIAQAEFNRQSQEAADKKKGESQTAEQKVVNEAPSNTPGQGTPPPAPSTVEPKPLTADEKAKLDASKTGTTDYQVAQARGDSPAPTAMQQANAAFKPSESRATAGEPSDIKKQEKASSVQGAGVTGKQSEAAVAPAGDTSKYYNKLHDYTSYTYRITLFLLEKKDYNALAASPSTFTPKYALISSASGYANPTGPDVTINNVLTRTSGRHPDFMDDFFIDNLTMTTIIGLNAKTKASNAIEIRFNITEPHGLSLLDRLLSACETSEDKNPNYIDQPYLLQVDFLASPSDPYYDKLKVSDRLIDRKRFAIKLLEFKINPSSAGTVYQCRAVPYNHTAFSMTVASVPVPMSIDAGTVGEFFGGAEDVSKLFRDSLNSNSERIETELQKWIKENSQFENVPSASEIEAQRKAIADTLQYKSTSFTAAYNEYMIDLATKAKAAKQPPTRIAFNIADSSIANSPIVDAENSQAGDSRMISGLKSIGVVDQDYKRTQVFQINAGTSIIDIIDRVMKKSDYIRNQIVTIEDQREKERAQQQYDSINGRQSATPETSKYLDWFKVVPQVVLNDFDAQRNSYSKTILYSIIPYKAGNLYHPNFEKTKIKDQQVVREYDYLYTGKNRDVMKLDVDFDSAFYTQITAYRDQIKRGGSSRTNDENDVKNDEYGVTATTKTPASVLPVTTQYAGSNASASTMNSAQSPSDAIVADLSKSLYSSSRGDMLNIKMTIIGDPAWIKQDDIYYNPGSPVDYNAFISGAAQTAPINPKTGQIMFDREQVFVQVNVKNAVDINDKIGITNKQTLLTNGRTTNGTFSGVYKLQRVDSTFSRGQFTQVLDLVRMPDNIKEVQAAPVNPGAAALNQTKQGVLDAIAPGSVTTSGQPNGGAGTGQKAADGTPTSPDPKLVSAANKSPTVSPTQTSGEGTPTQKSQPVEGAPSNASNAQEVAPQEKAPEPSADSVQSLAKLSADFDRLYQSKTKNTATTLEQAIAQGDSLYEQTTIRFNEKIAAARLNPSPKAAIIEEITLKLEREEWYTSFVFYTTNKIFFPAQKIDPYPDTFTSKITNVSQAIADRIKAGSESISKLVKDLRSIDEASFQSLKNQAPTIRANAKKEAQAFIGGT